VPAFLREDLESFCREAPADFTEHQRQVFCVFSGPGVAGLKRFLTTNPEFAEFLDTPAGGRRRAVTANGPLQIPDLDGFEDGDAIEDDEMGDGSEIALDPGNDEPLNPNHMAIPPPPPPAPFMPGVGLPTRGDGDPWSSTMFQNVVTGSPPATALDTFTAPAPLIELSTPTQASLDQSIASPVEQSHPMIASTARGGMFGQGGIETAGPSTVSFRVRTDDDEEAD
jgi:hypothetical protein